MWAVDRVLASADMLAEARAIHAEQRAMDDEIARAGAELIPRDARILTHCNTGPIATAGGGTALGVIIAAARAGRRPHVFVDETRPLLQGARLTYYELTQPASTRRCIVDGAAAITMQRQSVQLVIVGADRIARNGDTANKIGTYGLAIAAAHHSIPFYVAAPRSTFDFSLVSGEGIPIEERAAGEVTSFGSRAHRTGRRACVQSRLRRDAPDISLPHSLPNTESCGRRTQNPSTIWKRGRISLPYRKCARREIPLRRDDLAGSEGCGRCRARSGRSNRDDRGSRLSSPRRHRSRALRGRLRARGLANRGSRRAGPVDQSRLQSAPYGLPRTDHDRRADLHSIWARRL